MGKFVIDFERVDRAIEKTGIKVPADLVPRNYRWRAYLYANIFRGGTVTLEEKVMMIDLFKSLLGFHKIPWSRKELIPLDADCRVGIYRMLMDCVYHTESADVLRAVLWQVQALVDRTFYTDDHVLSLVPALDKYRRKVG